MGLSLADIDRWDPEAVREFFHGASQRAEGAHDASDGLRSLRGFEGFGGLTAEEARGLMAKARRDLDDHGEEAMSVAKAASRSADDIETIKRQLAVLREEASAVQATIGPDGSVTPPSGPMELVYPTLATCEEIEGRLRRLMADADHVDEELAKVFSQASGKMPIPPGPHENDPAVRYALDGHMPSDPKQFAALWHRLRPDEREYAYSKDHSIGNHAGMPFDDKNKYNWRHLPELINNQKRYTDYLGNQVKNGAPGDPISKYEDAKKKLAGLQKVEQTASQPDRYLGFVDDKGHAAISIGNPDGARNNATLVPGTGDDLSQIDRSDKRSRELQRAALAADPSLSPKDVSVTTWMGYDRPMDIPHAALTRYAHQGAGALDTFQDGMRASHDPKFSSYNTVIGHSYGSTMVGAAASDGHHLDVNRVIAVGSPGMLVDHASDLNLAPGGDVYVSHAHHDIIPDFAEGTTLGPGPEKPDFGAHVFDSTPGPTFGPKWLDMPSFSAHSTYFDYGSTGELNMAQLITGQLPTHKAR